ncbi:MAG TPA: tripartite tricarboxylate transporter substrate binding protein [Myxococcaceae bacterium]|nr:tripartite tricarboxylate transporter substrate binding protein [Myxococcaceae bacterium]
MRRIAAALVSAALVVATSALAAYPDRPVKLIVPWPAGGDTDSIYRSFQPHFQKHLGGTVVIANVAGASATKGAKEAKDAPADGYTILALHDSIHSTFHTGVADVNINDFQPICLVVSTPAVLTASPKTPWSDMKALLADAKARPGQIIVGATLGSTSHFFPALVERATGVKFKYVSYEGTAPRMTALMGGHIDLAESNLTQKSKVEAGQLKFLAIASPQRAPEMPSVPTLKELGIDLTYSVNRGLVAPKGTPAAVMSKLESACAAAAREPDFGEAMKTQGTRVNHLGSRQYLEFLKKNDALNKELAGHLGMLKK